MNIAIIAAKRTAIGTFMGDLSALKAHEIGAQLATQMLAQTMIDAAQIDEVILGQVLTAAQGQNPARQTALLAGLPHTTPAMTINQVCGSGLRAVALGAQAIAAGTATMVLAGGQESMSQAPHAAFLRGGSKLGDVTHIDTLLRDGLSDGLGGYHMGITAENLAEKYHISRVQQDAYAARSQQRTEAAIKAGIFVEEILPITRQTRKGEVTITQDGFPRFGTTAEALAKLKPAFKKDGTVTAGNASGINDGAAMVLLMGAEAAQKAGHEILAIIRSIGQAGVAPDMMGIGPVKASQHALHHAKWSLEDVDIIEANEAFAAQSLAVGQALGLDEAKINMHGGAIALGHPIGASGARILVTLLHHLKREKKHKGLATLCIGGGMGIAMCVERI